jgi:hypothetical protein
MDPSEERVSLKSRWKSEDLASKNRGKDEVWPYAPPTTRAITITPYRTSQDEPSCQRTRITGKKKRKKKKKKKKKQNEQTP